MTNFPQNFFTKNLIIILLFVQSLHNFAIYFLSIIFKVFLGTFENVPIFLNLEKNGLLEQNKLCQNIEKSSDKTECFLIPWLMYYWCDIH